MQFPSIEAFWLDNPAREKSEEADFGCHWHEPGDQYRWRVSYIRNTGEIYCVRLSPQEGPVEVLGRVPPDPVDEGRPRWGTDNRYYRTADLVLDEWAARCASEDGLSWLRSTLEKAGYGPRGSRKTRE